MPERDCGKGFSELSALGFLFKPPTPTDIASVNGEPLVRVEAELARRQEHFGTAHAAYGVLYGFFGAYFFPGLVRAALPEANQYSLIAHYSNFGATLFGMHLLNALETPSRVPRWLFASGGYLSAIAFNAFHEWRISGYGARLVDTGDIAYGAVGATVGLGFILAKPRWLAYRLMREELRRRDTGNPFREVPELEDPPPRPPRIHH
jgi:hypothetical protein